MELMDARPPYVSFEVRAVEDREKTMELGHAASKDVDYALITPPGSKDRVERVVSEWLQQCEDAVKQDRLPATWLQHFKAIYAQWKESNTIEVNGTDVRKWPLATPGQIETLIGANIRTVEDLAVATEEGLSRLGMGGRGLKQLAIDWLQSSKDVGKTAAELTALKAENERLSLRNAELETALGELKVQVQQVVAAQQAQQQTSLKQPETVEKDEFAGF